MAYILPAHIYELVHKEFRDEKKADALLRAIELSFSEIERELRGEIEEKKEVLKSAVYNELRNELATKEFVRAENAILRDEIHQEISQLREEMNREISQLREEMHQEINQLREEMYQEINQLREEMYREVSSLRLDIRVLDFQMKVLIGLVILGMSLMNPTFIELMRQIFIR